MKRAPLVFCYYTQDAYAIEAQRLRNSVERLGLDAEFIPLANLTSWAHAVMAKPKMILECLIRHPDRDILYVDADAEFVRMPNWSELEHVDLGWHEFKRNRHADIEYLTGTMYFANTPAVLDFVDTWVERTKDFGWHSTPEQASLKEVWSARGSLLIKRALGPWWTYIFDDFREIYPHVVPTILHHQASRRLRK